MADNNYSEELRAMTRRAIQDVNTAFVLGQQNPEGSAGLPKTIIFPSAYEEDLVISRAEHESDFGFLKRCCRLFCEWRMGRVYREVVDWPEPKEASDG